MQLPRLLLLLSLLISSHAFADLRTDIAKCATVKTDAGRLICFDQVSKDLKVDSPATEPITGNGKWRGRIETSPVDDSKNAFLSLDAETPVRKRYETKTPTLIIRCKERRLEAYIAFDLFLGSDSTKVLTRLDKRPAQNAFWTISTDHTSVFVAGNVLSFVRSLSGAENLLVELTPYSESPVMTTFDVRGLTEASKVLLQTCKVK